MASKTQYQLALEIGGKIAGSFGKSISTVNKQLSSIGKIAGAGAKIAGAGFVAAGAAIAGVAAASVNVGKEFESQMSTVQAISGATGEEFNQLEAKAKQMGATTQFSATEAGQAMEYMAMAGWKSSDMVGGIEGIMNLAAASGEDLATTSDIVTDALTAFGMSAADSGRFADVLAAASSNANTNVSMMGESFKYVAPLAGTLGYSAEDVSVALGLMANAGIKGSQAGTSLKTALANLSSPTDKQAAAMQKLGVSLTDSQGNMKSMRDVMGNLRSSFSGLSAEEQAAAASTIFGKEAMSGMLAIVNASEADFNKLTSAIDNSSGAAAQMAAIRLDNLEGDITLLKSGLEGLGIEIYQGMNAPLREATQTASEMVSQLNAAFQEGGFSGMVEAVGMVLSEAIVKISEFAPQFISMAVSLVMSFANGIASNSGQIASSATQVISVLIQGLLQAGATILVTGIQLIAQLGEGLAQAAPQIVSSGVTAIQYLIQGIISNLPSIISSAQTIILSLLQGLIAAAPSMVQGALIAIAQFITGIAQMLPQLLTMGIQLIFAILDGFRSGMGNIGEAVGQLATTIIDLIFTTDWLALGWDIIKALASGIWEGIKGLGKGIWEGIKGWFSGDDSAELELEGQSAAQSYASGVTSGISQAQTSASNASTAAMNGLNAGTQTAGTYGQGLVNSYSIGITGANGTATTAATTLGTNTVTALNSSLTAGTPLLSTSAQQAGTQTITGLTNGITSGTPTATTAALQMGTNTVTALNSSLTAGMPLLSTNALQVGTQTTTGLANGITSGTPAATTAASSLGSESMNALNSSLTTSQAMLMTNATALGSQTTNALGTGLNSGLPQVSATASQVGNDSIAAMSQSMQTGALQITATINQLSSDMQTAMSTAWQNITENTTTSFSGLSSQLTAEVTNIGTSVSTAFSGLSTQVSGSLSAVGASVTSCWTSISISTIATLTMIRTSGTMTFTALRMTATTNTTATVTLVIAQWRIAQTTLTATWMSFRSSYASAWSGVHSYAVSSARNTAAAVKSAFENMTITIPRPKLPHVNVSFSTVGGAGGASASVPNFSVSYYAKGGIMTQPTLFGMAGNRKLVGGEAGPEAIIPLDTLWDQLRNVVSQETQPTGPSLPEGTQAQIFEQLKNVMQFIQMQRSVGGIESKAQQLYNQVTNNQTTNNQRTENDSSSRTQFVYAPQVTIQGNADKKDIDEALSMTQTEFNRMMEEYERQKGRTAFA